MLTDQLARIEKQILLRAPRTRVWRALADTAQFAQWFGVEIEGTFAPGARVRMTSKVPGCEGEVFFVHIEQMIEPEFFSWRWHPGLQRPEVDYSVEPMTLVEFRLADAEGGTLLTVIESGFDRIGAARRAGVFEENEKGWEYQLVELQKHVGQSS